MPAPVRQHHQQQQCRRLGAENKHYFGGIRRDKKGAPVRDEQHDGAPLQVGVEEIGGVKFKQVVGAARHVVVLLRVVIQLRPFLAKVPFLEAIEQLRSRLLLEETFH